MDAIDVSRLCAAGNGPKDDGTRFQIVTLESIDQYGRQSKRVYVEHPAACYESLTKTIYLPFSDCPTQLAMHEICHAMRFKDIECQNLFPSYGPVKVKAKK
jgi:hypothetical protein